MKCLQNIKIYKLVKLRLTKRGTILFILIELKYKGEKSHEKI